MLNKILIWIGILDSLIKEVLVLKEDGELEVETNRKIGLRLFPKMTDYMTTDYYVVK